MAEETSFEGFSVGLHQGDSGSFQLIVRAQRGDAAAFQELIHSYDAKVMRAALALTGSEDPARNLLSSISRCVHFRKQARLQLCSLYLAVSNIG